MARIRGVLLDIEGTTTPVSFVYDVLFPFAEARLAEACARAGESPEIAAAVEILRREHAAEDGGKDPGGDVPAFGDGSPYATYLMASDRKSTGLKKLQGLIWREGYGSGELRGQVFDDVPDALERWRADRLELRIFSSGSVLAQKLLFSTTADGDLTVHFSGYHDTQNAGPKMEAESYRTIAAAFGVAPPSILFLSDVVAELDAATEAGMATGLLMRPGNQPVGEHRHREYLDFNALDPATKLQSS